MPGLYKILAAWILLVAGAAGAGAPPEPVSIRAERIDYDGRRGVFVARGEVVIEQGPRSLRADRVVLGEATRRGIAQGRVVLVDGSDTLRAEWLSIDLRSFTGVLLGGSYDSEQTGFRAEGARIEKTGDARYAFRDARFTTCRCRDPDAPPPWAIRAEEAALEVEGYGTARDARFEVLGIPVLWAPRLVYPVKTERQSGLLLPEIDYSQRNGAELGLPVFVAVGDPLNLTFTPRWLEKRGGKVDLEADYVLGAESEGALFGSFLYDLGIDPNSDAEPFGRARWAAKARQDFFLPLSLRAKTDVQLVSDNQYPTDFEGLGRARTQRFLESTAFVSGAFAPSGVLGLTAAVAFGDDLQNPDDQDRDDLVLQRFPQVDAAALPVPLQAPRGPAVVPALGLRYTYYDALGEALEERPTGVPVGGLFLDTGVDSLPDEQEFDFDPAANPDPNADNAASGGSEGDGLFQEGEPLIDRGHRVLMTPRIGKPLRLFDLLEFYPEVGWHQTLYESRELSFQERGLFIGRADLRTRLRRRFGNGWVHVLEPRVGWAFVLGRDQQGNPIFVPETAVPQRRLRQLDLDNVVLDPADRIPAFNGVTVELGNRLYRTPRGGGAPRLFADWVISSQYDAASGDFGVIYLDAHLRPWERADTRFILGIDPEAGEVDEALVDLEWRFPGGHRAGIGYRYLRRVGRFFEDFTFAPRRYGSFTDEFDRVNQIVGSLRLTLSERWSLTYRGGFSFEESLLIANRGGIEYLSRCRCWSAGVEVAQDRVRGVSVSFRYELVGLGRAAAAGRASRLRREGRGLLAAFGAD